MTHHMQMYDACIWNDAYDCNYVILPGNICKILLCNISE